MNLPDVVSRCNILPPGAGFIVLPLDILLDLQQSSKFLYARR
jgi:hypothetical protein